MRRLILIMVGFAFANAGFAQCESWEGKPNQSDLENAHVIYRQSVKSEKYLEAEEMWSKVFSEAPTADGKRDVQYFDGIEIYKKKLAAATSDEDKKALKAKALEIYDQLEACYVNGGLPTAGADALNKKLAFVNGRKAYDMYYYLNAPYSKNMEAIQTAIEKGGNDNEYIIFDPAAKIAVYQFKKEKMNKDEVVALYTQLNEIAEHNIAKGDTYSEYFDQAKKAMNAVFKEIEDDIFDCEYFKEQVMDDYKADPDNPDVLKRTIVNLKSKGCESSDPFMMEIEGKYKQYAEAENARKLAEFQANNPASVANKLYKEGDFNGAIDKYDEAIAQEEDPEKKASYLFSKASIQFRKLKQYSAARANAREAAKLKPNWGNPFMLIGDMYGTSARGCGDAWNQRLAIIAAIDKYNYAKSIDPSVADDASNRIGSYRKSLPEKQEGFMRGVKEGESVSVGCWIGETVRVRFKS